MKTELREILLFPDGPQETTCVGCHRKFGSGQGQAAEETMGKEHQNSSFHRAFCHQKLEVSKVEHIMLIGTVQYTKMF